MSCETCRVNGALAYSLPCAAAVMRLLRGREDRTALSAADELTSTTALGFQLAIVIPPSAHTRPVQPGCTNSDLDALLRSAAEEEIRAKSGPTSEDASAYTRGGS